MIAIGVNPIPILHLDDVDINYEVHGTGQPFMFCAATATHGDVWKFYQVAEFSREHQVIIFDQRGTGSSVSKSNDFSTKRLAADAAALLDHLGAPPAIVLGHSNGGRVAQLLTLDYPSKVKKLILASSGGASTDRGIPLRMCIGLTEKGYERYVREAATNTGFSKAYVVANPGEVERFMKVRCGNPPSIEIFLRHVIARQAYDPGDRLKEIRVPTLVMIGEDEDHGPPGHKTHVAYAKELSQQIPGAIFRMLEGQGHYYYFSNPHLTNSIIREFIAKR